MAHLNLSPASERNVWRAAEIDALRVVEEALRQHVAAAHPDGDLMPQDEVCETCAALLKREEQIGDQIHAL